MLRHVALSVRSIYNVYEITYRPSIERYMPYAGVSKTSSGIHSLHNIVAEHEIIQQLISSRDLRVDIIIQTCEVARFAVI